MSEPTIQRIASSLNPQAPRARARHEAQMLGIDARGLRTGEIKELVKQYQAASDDFQSRILQDRAKVKPEQPTPSPTIVTDSRTSLDPKGIRQQPGNTPTPREGPATVETVSGGGAFAAVFKASSKWYLQGGQVSGSDSNESISAIELGNVGSEPSDGSEIWLKIQGTAVLTDGVLVPDFDLTSVNVVTAGADNTAPTISSTSGTTYYRLGVWFDSVFRPDRLSGGKITVIFCVPSTFKVA